MVSIRHSLSFAVLMVSLQVACGKVVVEEGAPGGGGAAVTSTSSTGPGSTGSTGSTGGCGGLQSDLLTKLEAAQGCSPDIDVPQCSGSVTALDFCGCPVVANDTSFDAAQVAIEAFEAWAGAGCGPNPCFACPPPPTSPWYCDSTDAVCKPVYTK
jgi:hypothetical protein